MKLPQGKPNTMPFSVPVSKSTHDTNKFDREIRECLYKDLFPHDTPLTNVVNHIFNDNGRK